MVIKLKRVRKKKLEYGKGIKKKEKGEEKWQ